LRRRERSTEHCERCTETRALQQSAARALHLLLAVLVFLLFRHVSLQSLGY
jgi:hypothetical protein